MVYGISDKQIKKEKLRNVSVSSNEIMSLIKVIAPLIDKNVPHTHTHNM